MRWEGDAEAFVAWCQHTKGVGEFARALETVPASEWDAVAVRLNDALNRNKYSGGRKLDRLAGEQARRAGARRG